MRAGALVHHEAANDLGVYSPREPSDASQAGAFLAMERLQKILSQAGIASRRASEQLMIEGRVTVNGDTIRELGTKADASKDDIRVDGRRIKVPEHHRYVLLNK